MGELGEVVRQQKLRVRGLAQEKAEACARLQASNPQASVKRATQAAVRGRERSSLASAAVRSSRIKHSLHAHP